jgi:hypothetical protein
MRKTIAVLSVLCFLAAPAAAKQTESVSPNYDFSKVKTVLVMDPTFANDGFNVSGNNKFVQYPYAAEKIAALFGTRKHKIPSLQYITLAYVTARVKADPALDGSIPEDPKEFSALLQREMPKYADLVLYMDIRDFGWFYEWQEAYYSTETRYERVEYGGKTADGKKYSGWMEVPRTVVVHHPAHHNIFDCAEARFALLDTRTWRYVWQFTDQRARSSFAWRNDHDPTGPESMMNRIFDDAIAKMPMHPRDGD